MLMRSGQPFVAGPRGLSSLFLFLLFAAASAVPPAFAATGGPDAYGYVWKDSLEVDGPIFAWVDITGVGTEVSGLADDNSVPMVDIGFTFPFYWASYNQIKIGSNGWLSFADVANVAHCFPTLPTPGGAGDLLVAPFMSDLIMNGAGNPAQVFYYHDQANARFIISFLNVPFWQVAAPGYVGSNTFQVVFESDGVITFQYGDVDQANFTDQAGCAADLEIGIENQTGNIGLEVYNDTVPADDFAISFIPPDTPLIDVPDATPSWTLNNDSQGVFLPLGQDFLPTVRVDNVGNADILSDIDVMVTIRSNDSTIQYQETEVVELGLAAGAGSDELFPNKNDLAAGTFSLEAQTINGEDVNPSNDTRTAEVVVVDTAQPDFTVSYSTEAVPDGALSWTGDAGGAAVHIEPPSYPVRIDSVEMYIMQPVPAVDGFQIEVLDDNGLGGTPGSVYVSEDMPPVASAWQSVTLADPPTVYSGGLFVAWHQGGPNMAIGTEASGPISRRSWEYLGTWAPYRDRDSRDLMIKVTMTPLEAPFFFDDFESGDVTAWSTEF